MLQICCKTQIITSFYFCSNLVTAFIHYFATSKLLILSSATLELALICLTAVINCTNSHLSIDVFFATAIDMFCSVGHIMLFDLIWFVIIFSPHNWMAFVRLNKRHVMLCYVIWMNSRQPESNRLLESELVNKTTKNTEYTESHRLRSGVFSPQKQQ